MQQFFHGYSPGMVCFEVLSYALTPVYNLGIWPFPEPITFHSLRDISEETIAFNKTTDVYMSMTATHAESLISFPFF